MTGDNTPSLRLVRSSEDDVLARLYDELEGGLFDRNRTVLDRFRPYLDLFGAICLGAVAAGLSMFIIFFVVNMIFHYQP